VLTARVALVRADGEARLQNAFVLVGLLLWMAYTRVFWAASALHVTLPPCPFLRLTGHPCPFCGGTRSFAYMWQGDLRHASLLYPLGPALFVGTLLAIPLVAAAVLSGRTVRLHVPERLRRTLVAVVLGVLGVSWALKLTVLPN
jgi:uncharacterized protein DUF2752